MSPAPPGPSVPRPLLTSHKVWHGEKPRLYSYRSWAGALPLLNYLSYPIACTGLWGDKYCESWSEVHLFYCSNFICQVEVKRKYSILFWILI